MMRKITILHIFPDEKFFDGISYYYDNIPNVENRYIYYTRKKNYAFKYIKNANKIKIVNSLLEYVKEFRAPDVEIVFFHSLAGISYLYMCLIPMRIKVIWWEWGFDIYHSLGKGILPPLLSLELYKPNTKVIVDQHIKEQKWYIKLLKVFIKPIYSTLQKEAIKRVDYMLPCIPVEHEILKRECPFFKAELYPYIGYKPQATLSYNSEVGNIIIGNSLTYSNNHLDIFESISNCDIDDNRRIYIPVSYGGDYHGYKNLIDKAEKIKQYNVKWLKELMPSREYFTMMKSVSHAIYGVIRQQAMGNIFYCLYHGIKLYLYNDSVVAQQLKKDGYIFFSIENDLNSESLSKCLTEEEAKYNYHLFIQRFDGHGLLDIRNKLEQIVSK